MTERKVRNHDTFSCNHILVVGFLILSIPILFLEWLIGKWNPRFRDLSSLRIVQFMFKLILKVAGTKVTVIGEEQVPTDIPVPLHWKPQKLF